jgi:hypothetical protein
MTESVCKREGEQQWNESEFGLLTPEAEQA